ncbi:MAG: hypothetical protein HUK03_04385 [Bacteroidaceae bacterium]|nr:hypothetical protein [Bacteroidaceae bacterium]
MNEREPGKVASNAIMYLTYDEEGRGFLRLRKPLFRNTDIVQAFKRMGEVMERLSHPHFITLDTYLPDEEGGAWRVAQEGLLSLANQLTATPGLIADEQWKDKFIRSLLQTVEYTHRRELFMVDMSLDSVMVSGRADHRLYLLPPCSEFLFCKDQIWKTPTDYLAEEVLNTMEVDKRADIYAIGRIISKLYHYTGVPYLYRKAVKRAIIGRADNRAETIGELNRLIESGAKGNTLQVVGTTIVILALAIVLGVWFFDDGTDTRAPQPDDIRPEAYNDSLYEERLRNEVESYLNDTTYLLQDTAYTLSEEMKAKQRENIEKTQEVFRREFTRRATPCLKRIYGKDAFRQDSTNFEKIVREESAKLQKMQIQLAEQYGLEIGTANRISGEVINQLSEEFREAK